MSTTKKRSLLVFVATCALSSTTIMPLRVTQNLITHPATENINIINTEVLNNEEVTAVESIEIERGEVVLEQLVAEEAKLNLSTYYDVPLSYELQDYIRDLCNVQGLQMELVVALIQIESEFQPHAISKTNDYGLMQINKVNHSMLRKKYGVTDFLDPKQNIICGVGMLSELHGKFGDMHKVLMAYNMGEGNARKHWNNGTVTSRYSRKVVSQMEKYMY